MSEISPNQDGSFFEPVTLETLMALEEVIANSPHAVKLDPRKASRLNPQRLLGSFLYLELENKDSGGGDASIFIDGDFVEWFSEEVTVYGIDLCTSFTAQGWHNAHYMIIRNDDGEMLATRQDNLVEYADEDVFQYSSTLHGALEGDEESLMDLYTEALKQRDQTIEEAKAFDIEHKLGLSQVSEQEIKELINLIKTGTLPDS